MSKLLQQATDAEVSPPKVNSKSDFHISPMTFGLTGIALLLAIEIVFLWFFFISPHNILLRLALILLTFASVMSIFLPRLRKFKLCFVGFALLGISLLATPVAWDERIASMRYGIQAEYFPMSLGITETTKEIGFRSGEKVGIERWQIPNLPLYVPKEFDDGSCYLQMTNISPDFVLHYGVCPSAITGLSVNKYFFRFW